MAAASLEREQGGPPLLFFDWSERSLRVSAVAGRPGLIYDTPRQLGVQSPVGVNLAGQVQLPGSPPSFARARFVVLTLDRRVQVLGDTHMKTFGIIALAAILTTSASAQWENDRGRFTNQGNWVSFHNHNGNDKNGLANHDNGGGNGPGNARPGSWISHQNHVGNDGKKGVGNHDNGGGNGPGKAMFGDFSGMSLNVTSAMSPGNPGRNLGIGGHQTGNVNNNRANGAPGAPGMPVPEAVPEPATLAVLAFGAAALLKRRRTA